MGVVLFANGVAKLFEFRRIELGPYVGNLIDKGAARSILQNGVGEQERSIPGLRPVLQLMIDHWVWSGGPSRPPSWSWAGCSSSVR